MYYSRRGIHIRAGHCGGGWRGVLVRRPGDFDGSVGTCLRSSRAGRNAVPPVAESPATGGPPYSKTGHRNRVSFVVTTPAGEASRMT